MLQISNSKHRSKSTAASKEKQNYSEQMLTSNLNFSVSPDQFNYYKCTICMVLHNYGIAAWIFC